MRIPLSATLFATFLAIAPAYGQNAPSDLAGTAYALDAKSLQVNGRTVILWGIDPLFPAGTAEHIKSRVILDDIVGEAPIRCFPKNNPTGNQPLFSQCLNAQERDIALSLIANGYATTNRRQLDGTELANPYIQAERRARQMRAGLWGAGASSPSQSNNNAPVNPADIEVSHSLPMSLIMGLIGVPLVGFLMLAFILHRGFKELLTLQKYQIAGTQKRERELKAREKHVVAAALESEINTNRAKLDAYLIIYEELLKSLRDPAKTPKYQRAGDIIHDKPALTRTVYDTNLDKLDVLGPDITSKLAALYQNIDPNPDYRTLEPEMPIEKVWEMVERIIRNAEKLTDPMDELSGALNVILRSGR